MSKKLILVCGQRGAGKETLIRAVLPRFPGLHRIVPHTTRSPRPGEKNGREYHFVTHQTFHNLIGEGKFLWYGRIGETQLSGTLLDEFNFSPIGSIVDVLPVGARKMRDEVRHRGGRTFTILVGANVDERRVRIKKRDPNLSEKQVEKLIRDDPVPEVEALDHMKDFNAIMSNSGDDPLPFCQRSILAVEKFLSE